MSWPAAPTAPPSYRDSADDLAALDTATDDLTALAAAVARLDARGVAGWRDRVDPRTLDMARSSACVLGQLFGDYWAGVRALYGGYDPCLGALLNTLGLRAFGTRFPRELWVEYLRATAHAAGESS